MPTRFYYLCQLAKLKFPVCLFLKGKELLRFGLERDVRSKNERGFESIIEEKKRRSLGAPRAGDLIGRVHAHTRKLTAVNTRWKRCPIYI